LEPSMEEINQNPPGGIDPQSENQTSSDNPVADDSDEMGHFSSSRNGNSYTKPNPSQVTNRVYVGNLSWQTSWQDLKDHMRKAGNVVYADVFLDEQGKSKGCGIVEYSAREEALEAIKILNDTKIPNTERPIFIREDREDPNFVPGRGQRGGVRGRGRGRFVASFKPNPVGRSTGRQIFVGNLPYTTSWQELKDHFRSCGRIIRADTLIGSDGRPKGQGTVLFEAPFEAQKAIETFNNTEFQGRMIFVQEDKYA